MLSVELSSWFQGLLTFRFIASASESLHQVYCFIRCIAIGTSDVWLLGRQMYGYWDIRCMAIGTSNVWLLGHQMYGYWDIRRMAIVTSDVWLLGHQIYSIRFIASASEKSILVYLYLCCLICFIWLGCAPEQCKLKTVQSGRDWFVSVINIWCFRRGDCKGSNWDQVGWMVQRNWTSLVLTVDVLKQKRSE